MKKLLAPFILFIVPFGVFASNGTSVEVTTASYVGATATTTPRVVTGVETETSVGIVQYNESNLEFVQAPSTGGEAASDVYLKIEGVDGESGEKKGNGEYEWKVEEGESAKHKESGEKAGTEDINIGVGELQNTSINPDEIDFMGDSENATNFGILLGGGSDEEGEDEERARGLERARQVLEENAKASDQAIESVSLNFEKITTRVREEVRLFGFIPIGATAEVDIDLEQRVSVRFPWWTFFATGDDEAMLGERIYNTISNVLKTKHDTVKNSIRNVR